MKTYELTVRLEGKAQIEDPHCPSQWRNSGCYDILVRAWCMANVEVNAENIGEAKRLAELFEYDDCEMAEVNEVIVSDVDVLCVCEDDDQNAGVVDVSYGEVEIYKYE